MESSGVSPTPSVTRQTANASAAKAIDTGESVAVKKVCSLKDIVLLYVGYQHLFQTHPHKTGS
jgi:hypothetical protein